MQLDYDQEPLEGGEDADVVDIFALPEDMVYESAEKKKNERASKKEIAYIRGEDAVINTMVRTPPPLPLLSDFQDLANPKFFLQRFQVPCSCLT